MAQTNTRATKIMIIRHAEKPPKTPPPNPVDIDGVVAPDSLIVAGWQRAGALAVLFAPSRGPLQDHRLKTPQFLFASSTSAEEGNRPEETVTPLMSKLTTPGGTLQTDFSIKNDDVAKVAQAALDCDGVVLISWPHGKIPALAQLIPLGPNNKNPIPTSWPSDRFDIVFVFDLDVNTPVAGYGYIFSQVPQLLLAGDSPEPIS